MARFTRIFEVWTRGFPPSEMSAILNFHYQRNRHPGRVDHAEQASSIGR